MSAQKSVVPMSFTIGLCLASIVLSVAGYGFRLMFGDDVAAVLRHAMVVVPFFVIVLPALMWLGSVGLNKMGKASIHPRNALTLGWLLSVVSLLSIMGVYS
ncbi:hypothetical protein [uncultured Moraxella sp.]|uniref:hypothetical protein n=1 Tax=uncultured Moraxella sp. TaxID=263769 RepID=UPI0025E44E40|nr:hypothetical protein [uncultured Moraxella sp.]